VTIRAGRRVFVGGTFARSLLTLPYRRVRAPTDVIRQRREPAPQSRDRERGSGEAGFANAPLPIYSTTTT